MTNGNVETKSRVSTLELFFDLVFVLAITQLTEVVSQAPLLRSLFQAVLMLGLIWWMYGGYAWLTNAVAPDRMSRRAVLLAAMAGYLVLALAIPDAFGDSGAAFGGAYLFIVIVHFMLFTRAGQVDIGRALRGLGMSNVATALLVLAGGVAGGTAQYLLWGLAFVMEWVTPRVTEQSAFHVETAHFVERHGLVVIVALGESVVAVGIGAAGLDIDLELVVVAVCGLLLSACLWWTYFGGDEEAAERALAAAPPGQRARWAVDAFGYAFLPLLLGIVTTAAALKKATGHPFEPLESARALQMAGGVALFMAGDALFRAALRLPALPWRLLAGVAAFATIPLGTEAFAELQIAALVAILAGA